MDDGQIAATVATLVTAIIAAIVGVLMRIGRCRCCCSDCVASSHNATPAATTPLYGTTTATIATADSESSARASLA
jgi:hypothetical protein